MSKEATKDALLAAARTEFAAYGIAGARVDRIAERAGVNKERIYGYFGSKEKLFDQVVATALDEVVEAVAMMPGDDPAEYVGKLHDFHIAHPDLTRLLMWESLHYRDGDLEGQEGRVASWTKKADSLAAGLGTESSRETARTMLTLVGLAVWPTAMPRLGRLALGEEATTEEGRAAMREHLIAFTRAALGR
ncbi:TetR/AcrR family transcriptional regulator [Planobispora longispora]|uniref:HTH-type transcriptional repressor n=1 Tax=Planobispora longispora TaxID=28887 RepID=A0A8J3RF69_9ACTN|nr:TetR family transcriptional regulator [Planobispora longispora]BFE78029.1 TetR family transcriptional regulator [Planobispora longispora]GIH73615.1 HTH-type transcriptional repressor [Planobispora longispora]